MVLTIKRHWAQISTAFLSGFIFGYIIGSLVAPTPAPWRTSASPAAGHQIRITPIPAEDSGRSIKQTLIIGSSDDILAARWRLAHDQVARAYHERVYHLTPIPEETHE